MSYALYSTLEQLNNVAMDMRRRGVLVNWDAYAKHCEHYWEVTQRAQAEFLGEAPQQTKTIGKKKLRSIRIYQLGHTGTHGSLRRLFWDHYGLKPLLFSKETGAPQLNAWTLQQYSVQQEQPRAAKLAAIVLRCRKAAKILTTYLNKLPVSADGRIHTSWNVWGTITGRWSSSGPNMQNVPKKLRNMFVSRPGWYLSGADWDKLELRIVAVLANDEPLLHAFSKGVDVHTQNAEDLFGQLAANSTERKKQRDFGKRFVYGANYGASAETIWAALVVDFPQMQLLHIASLLKRWFEKHQAIKRWHVRMLREARNTWKVVCPVGHREEIFHDGRIEPNKVINFPAQAVAGWLANRAILRWHERVKHLGFVTLQVHDELVGEFPEEHIPQAAAELKAAMEEPVILCGKEWVFPCELKIGENWGNLVSYSVP